MADILRIKLPDQEQPYDIVDGNAVHLRFRGKANTYVEPNSTTDPQIPGYTIKRPGDVIVNTDNTRLIWIDNKWNLF